LKALLPQENGGLNIRHHGDFHLGQLLIVKDDIYIVDFDGEARRSIADRRRKAPAAGDVASMVRSIDYSTTAALERALKVAHDENGRLGAALAEWRNRATAAFLSAYREAMVNKRLWPADPEAAESMLNFFLLEKACYEIEYELSYRPDWLRTALTGMLRILPQQSLEAL
jgi:maltose alpha-D-glucosyltransferase/alpha-amylase